MSGAMDAIAGAVGGVLGGLRAAGLAGDLGLTRTTPGAYDEATLTTGAPTVTAATVFAVATDTRAGNHAPEQAVEDVVPGTTTRRRRRRLFVPARAGDGTPIALVPAPDDAATWAGATWRVEAVTPIQPDGATAAAYWVDLEA